MEIPYQKLSQEALEKVIEEYITREGTDYGQIEYSLEEKRKSVEAQIKSGSTIIVYDSESETVNLIPKNS